ncbi:MAG: carboxyl transferase [Butyrivibrio sp.]|nr:carboxyl transferase [Butyrivibrio sp.]
MSSSSQASERIRSLLDDNSFAEIGALVAARNTDFGLKQAPTPSDGVVTGYGTIDGRLVYVYSQDVSVLGGSVGEMHARKIARVYELATKTGAPVIGLIDSAGLRLQEATDALNAFGEIYAAQVNASGVIPQITAIFGNCGGGLALIPAITDFTFMETKSALYVNAPNVLAGNYKEKCDTSSAGWQSTETANVDVVADENELIAQIRALAAFLPSNNEDTDSFTECTDSLNRACPNLDALTGDPAAVAAQIADGGVFFETKRGYAREMVTGFIRMNGAAVGLIGNRTKTEDGKESYDAALTANGCEKAADFIRFCDAFDIPVLTLTNVKGYGANKCDERRVARGAARLAYALASATVPKVNLVMETAFGSAYTVMNSRALGADMTFAWPGAQIGTMDADLAAKILAADGDASAQAECAQAYRKLQNNVESAAAHGYVDAVIEPSETRKYVIGALEMLFTKREDRPARKHGTV